MAEAPIGETTVDERTYCAVHPTVETTLKCNRCGRYMCTRCAVRTPVGYRCRQCVYQQQDAFYKANQRDLLVAAGVGFALSIPVNFILPRIFLIGIFLLSLPAGAFIGELVFRACGRRKGRQIPLIVGVAIAVGALVANFQTVSLLLELLRYGEAVGSLVGELLLFPAIAAVLVIIGAVGRLR